MSLDPFQRPSCIKLTIFSFESLNICVSTSSQYHFCFLDSNSRNGAIVSDWEKAYATWLTKPNQDRRSMSFSGTGKFLIESSTLFGGRYPSRVNSNPANSQDSSANTNFSSLKTIPLSAQCFSYSKVCQKASSMESSHSNESSTHRATRSKFWVMSSNLRV